MVPPWCLLSNSIISSSAISFARFSFSHVGVKWHTEFGHLNRGDMLTSEQHRCSNEKKKF
ncbi:hypothetical protein CBL31_11530 [Shigella flexneri]|nr:hypothetical protein CBL31_11530 [Shigella flexneri]